MGTDLRGMQRGTTQPDSTSAYEIEPEYTPLPSSLPSYLLGILVLYFQRRDRRSLLNFTAASILPWWEMEGRHCEGNLRSIATNPARFAISASDQGLFPRGQQASETPFHALAVSCLAQFIFSLPL